MSLLYVLVTYEKTILCEYSEYKGSFTSVCINLLSKIQKDSIGKLPYNNDINVIYLNSNEITFFTLSEINYDENNAKDYLLSIKNQFFLEFSNKDDFIQKNKDNHFQNILKEKMKEFNNKQPFNSDTIDDLKETILKQRDFVIDTEKLLNERNEKVNNINEKTEALLDSSISFRKKTRTIKKKMKSNKCCIITSGIIITLIILYGAGVYFCGGLKLDNCIKL